MIWNGWERRYKQQMAEVKLFNEQGQERDGCGAMMAMRALS